jgi:hypothetical protein
MQKQYDYYMKTGNLNMMWVVPSEEVVLGWAMEKIERAFGKKVY